MMRSLLSSRRLMAAALFLFLEAPAWAGTFFSDFESGLPSGASVYGNALVDSSGGATNNGGVLKLTVNSFSQTGSFIIDDLDPGQRIGSFLVTFQLLIGGGTTTPGDGCSFNFAPDLPNAAFAEDGAGSGITVAFDTYDNGTGDAQEGPEIRVKAAGGVIASRKILGQFKTGANFVNVLLRYNPSGTMDIVFNNQVLFTNLWVIGAQSAGCRFGFSGRCGGGANENHFVDNLSITTTSVGSFYVKGGTLPSPPLAAAPDAAFKVSLNDFGAAVLTNGITMYFNGGRVYPALAKPGNITTITYDPPGGLLPGSSNNVSLIVADSNAGTTTLSYNFTVSGVPYWGLAPGSRSYLTVGDGATTPLARSIGYNALSNQLYVLTRTGPSTGAAIHVLDPNTGADLYQLNTTGIGGGSIILLSLAVADDGAIYAANEVANSGGLPVKIYRWADSNPGTAPSVVYSGDPGASLTAGLRWGDTLAARGLGGNTQLIMDCQNTNYSAIFAPTNGTLAGFTNAVLTHAYIGTTIGRALQFGPGNTYWLKKKSNGGTTQFPLNLIQFNPDWSTAIITSVSNFHLQFGSIALDPSKNLAAGIFFATNAVSSYDRLVVYDLSTLTNPLQVATYNFPVVHVANNNFIGQVVFGPDKIFAIDGNNGVLAVPAFAPAPPKLTITPSGTNVVLSWPNAVPGFVLQGLGDAGISGWNTLNLPITTNLSSYSTTVAASSTNVFYRLFR